VKKILLIVTMEAEIPDGFKSERDISVLVTGSGMINVEKKLKSFLERNDVDFIVCTGFCGGTTDNFGIGQLIVANQAIYGQKEIKLAIPKKMVKRLGKMINLKIEKIQSFDHLVTSRDKIKKGVMAVDMEVYKIAQIAKEQKIPLIIAKVISDIIPITPVIRAEQISEIKKNMVSAKTTINLFWEIAKNILKTS